MINKVTHTTLFVKDHNVETDDCHKTVEALKANDVVFTIKKYGEQKHVVQIYMEI
jgi:hypothetical protein